MDIQTKFHHEDIEVDVMEFEEQENKKISNKTNFNPMDINIDKIYNYMDYFSGNNISVSPELLMAMKDKTIFSAAIRIIINDTLGKGYVIKTEDDDLDAFFKEILKVFTWEHQKMSLTDMLVYGNSFDFIQWSADEKMILDFYEMSVNNVEEMTDKVNDNSDVLVGWKYGEDTYDLTDILHLTLNRNKGELYGKSHFLPGLSVWQILSNIYTNMAIILHNRASPKLHHKVGSKQTFFNQSGQLVSKPASDDELKKYRKEVAKNDPMMDLATPNNVDIVPIEQNGTSWNFENTLTFMNEQLFVILGVPAMLLGFGGVNKEISTRQLQKYYDFISGLQKSFESQNIKQIWRPLANNLGKFDTDISFEYPEQVIESTSESYNKMYGPMREKGEITLAELREKVDMSPIRPEENQELVTPNSVLENEMKKVNNKTME